MISIVGPCTSPKEMQHHDAFGDRSKSVVAKARVHRDVDKLKGFTHSRLQCAGDVLRRACEAEHLRKVRGCVTSECSPATPASTVTCGGLPVQTMDTVHVLLACRI